MSPLAFFSHATAARLWQLPLPWAWRNDPVLHVSVPRGNRAPTGRGIQGHALSVHSDDVTSVQGVRVSTLERTVLDLARSLDEEQLLAIVDNALWHKRDIMERATAGSIRATLDRTPTRLDRPRILGLLELASDRSDSAPESAFRLRFIRAGFPEVEANQPIHDARGLVIAQPDLLIRRFRLAFDYEGDHHRTDRHQWRKDLGRTPSLEDAGWHHSRLSGEDLANPSLVVSRTRRRLTERGWSP